MRGTTPRSKIFYRRLLFIIMFLLLCVPVFSKGRREAPVEVKTVNPEWVLVVTNFDVSSLSPSRQILGGILLRSLTESLRNVDSRVRDAGETVYYQDLAWSKTSGDAARALAAKRNERDLMAYRGDPVWKYEKNLLAIDADIKKLEEEYDAVLAAVPGVAAQPLVTIKGGENGSWPAAPVEGEEYRFCSAQKTDAFLTGKVSEYYGRIYLTLRLYTLYTRSYSWEDSILFSSEDMNEAMSELASRLAVEVSGIDSAAIVVHVSQEEAMILIGGSWGGRGEAPLREMAPGSVIVSAYADNYVPVSYPVEINANEITEIQFNLTPLGLSSFVIDVPGSPYSSVFLGSLFLGKTPLEVQLPRDQYSYISVETPEGQTGSVLYGRGTTIRGSAEFVDAGRSLFFKTSVPVSPEEGRVATARKKFYSAYGRLWIGLPLGILAIGMTSNYVKAYNYRPTMGFYNSARNASYIRIGAWAVIGVVAGETVFRIIRYLLASRSDADPIARFEPETNQ